MPLLLVLVLLPRMSIAQMTIGRSFGFFPHLPWNRLPSAPAQQDDYWQQQPIPGWISKQAPHLPAGPGLMWTSLFDFHLANFGSDYSFDRQIGCGIVLGCMNFGSYLGEPCLTGLLPEP